MLFSTVCGMYIDRLPICRSLPFVSAGFIFVQLCTALCMYIATPLGYYLVLVLRLVLGLFG